MLTFLKTKKLSILVILAGLTYAFLVFNTLFNSWDDFKTGWNEGAQNTAYDSSGKIKEDKPLGSFYLSVKPKNGVSSFPDSLVNQKTNMVIKSKYRKTIVLGPSDSHKSAMVYVLFKSLFALIVTITYVIIAIHFYKLIGSFKKEFIFEQKNIRLLRWLGFELLIVYFGNVLFNFFHYKINCSIFSFSEYEIVMDSADDIWLLFGIVVLLAAEVLSKALVLKEEQELTI